MSADSNFIARWSRLKQQAAEEKSRPRPGSPAEDRPAPPDAEPHAESEATPAGMAGPVEADPPFDPASLPPIESIVAGTDIRPFLQKGVPGALTRAALRRAWTADPAIRDFIEMAENQWDFTDPTAIPGFGPLQAGDNVRQLVDQALGKLAETATDSTEAAKAPPESNPTTADAQPAAQQHAASSPEGSGKSDTGNVAALQHADAAHAAGNAPRRKAHGRALPR